MRWNAFDPLSRWKITAGFTFIEIILVVIILGVLSAVSLPYLNNSYKNFLVQSCAGDVAALMRFAQGRAITHNRAIQFVFEDGRKAYRLKESPLLDDGTIPQVTFESIPGRWGRMFRIPSDIQVESNGESVEFLPDGQIQKTRIFFRHAEACMTVSTQEQRGRIFILNGHIEKSE